MGERVTHIFVYVSEYLDQCSLYYLSTVYDATIFPPDRKCDTIEFVSCPERRKP